MDISENTGLLCAGDSSMYLASAPSDSVTRSTVGDASSAPPPTLHPKLTYALQLMRRGNYREAIPLLEQAAADGSAEADVELAECFAQGWGTPPNPARALEHASRSASRGITEGRFMAAWWVARAVAVQSNASRAILCVPRAVELKF
jgi:TPR repeat protein